MRSRSGFQWPPLESCSKSFGTLASLSSSRIWSCDDEAAAAESELFSLLFSCPSDVDGGRASAFCSVFGALIGALVAGVFDGLVDGVADGVADGAPAVIRLVTGSISIPS